MLMIFRVGKHSITNDIFAIMSSANAESDDDLTGYLSQLYILYDDGTDDLEMHSEVHGVDSSSNYDEACDCEVVGNTCQDFGNASNIYDVDSVMYWYSGDIKYYSFVDIKIGSDTYGYNTNYDPGSNSEESPTQFQSGTYDDGTIKYKLTQWGIESETPEANNWDIELSGMKTYDGNYSYFVGDTAKTTDYSGGYTDGSYITFRDISVNRYTIQVGTSDNCVDRNGNTDGIIDLDDVSSNCLAVPTTLWS